VLKSNTERYKLAARITEVFTPSAPVDEAELFSGRSEQVREVINAVFQRGQHAIIYGERGVGKTSLANVLSSYLPDRGVGGWNTVIANCDATTNFSSLWQQVAREMTVVQQDPRIGFGSETSSTQLTLDSLLPLEITPDDVRHLFEKLAMPTIIILDEMDRINDKATTTRLADTVKTLSDHSVDVTLILVGVADSVDDLIAEHRSIERALVQIQMPRMSDRELFEIVEKGLGEVQMTIESKAKQHIAKLSQGLPHFTHLLSLHAAQNAALDGRINITEDDVEQAIRLAVDKTAQSIVSDYHAATSSPRDTLFPQVLLACALAEKDQLGYFSAVAVRRPLRDITGKPYDIPSFARHLNIFCEEARGPILQKTGQRKRYLYRFVKPMMEPYTTMKGLESGLITNDDLDRQL
jgi:Cdc6-like AAA superfamily ATPase